jgi:hypothetical protein
MRPQTSINRKEEDNFMSDQKKPEPIPEEVKEKQLIPEDLTEEQLREISGGGQPPIAWNH